MSQFESESTVAPSGEGAWTAALAPEWSIGDNLNGGYAAAPVLRALRELGGLPDPISATTHFLRPVQGGAAEIATRLVRRGRSVSVATGTLSALGTERLVVGAVFGDLADAETRDDERDRAPEPPSLPEPDRCIDRAELSQGVDLHLLQRLDVRVDSGGRSSGAAEAVVQGWIRLADGSAPDVVALTVFADCFPPALTSVIDEIGWVPTIELTVHVRRRPAPGWIGARFECDDVAGGRMIESGTLWDSTGAVVARCRQLGIVTRRG